MSTSKRLIFSRNAPGHNIKNVTDILQTYLAANGHFLNQKEWRGMPPKSCAITRASSIHNGEQSTPTITVEVTYRPKSLVSYVGKTRYHGWQVAVPTKPKALQADGEEAKYVLHDIDTEVDFDNFEFGAFVREESIAGPKRTTIEAVYEELIKEKHFCLSLNATFVAQHRNRPYVKIAINNEPDGTFTSDFNLHVININIQSENLEQKLAQQVEHLVCQFIEGKVSLKTSGNGSITFVHLSDILVDNELSKDGLEPSFNILHQNTPGSFLDDLARRLMSIYRIDVEVVTGKDCGLLLRTEA